MLKLANWLIDSRGGSVTFGFKTQSLRLISAPYSLKSYVGACCSYKLASCRELNDFRSSVVVISDSLRCFVSDKRLIFPDLVYGGPAGTLKIERKKEIIEVNYNYIVME